MGPADHSVRSHSPPDGIVVAGGRSKRFGDREKALVTIDGEPMLVRVVRRLAPAVGRVIVNCRRDQADPFSSALSVTGVESIQFAIDSDPDEGPLAGVVRALDRVETASTVVVACDMPGVEPAVLRALHAYVGDYEAAVPVNKNGRLHPVQAVYRTQALRSAGSCALAADQRSMAAALDRLEVVTVTDEDVPHASLQRSLVDVNTRGDLRSFGTGPGEREGLR